MSKRILVLGLGNDILSDDRIGLDLVKDIADDMHDRDICFMSASSGGLETVEIIGNFDKVLIIDAIKTNGGNPGDVYYFSPDDFRDTVHLSSFHDMSFLTACELSRQVLPDLTRDMHIIAIEIIEDMVFNDELTPVLKSKYELIKENVKSIISSILQSEV